MLRGGLFSISKSHRAAAGIRLAYLGEWPVDDQKPKLLVIQ